MTGGEKRERKWASDAERAADYRRRKGIPIRQIPTKETNDLRFRSKIEIVMRTPELGRGPCWEWQGHCVPGGYGQFRWDNRGNYAHVYGYEMKHGPVPNGLEVDHLCRNQRCCNPDHLEAVTHRENQRRSPLNVCFNPALRRPKPPRTHCFRGHSLADGNLGARGRCNICNRARARKWEQKHKAKQQQEAA